MNSSDAQVDWCWAVLSYSESSFAGTASGVQGTLFRNVVQLADFVSGFFGVDLNCGAIDLHVWVNVDLMFVWSQIDLMCEAMCLNFSSKLCALTFPQIYVL